MSASDLAVVVSLLVWLAFGAVAIAPAPEGLTCVVPSLRSCDSW